ncbi:MAG: type IV pilus assembly protein PilM [Candidatus Doudnabacteria bacterium]|nr:type IV pilus assembly protein PilM [Candidatus Doudnabacteria bacterium]
MISLFGNKKIQAFGLDISDASIKVMNLRRREQSLIPDAFADQPLPPKIISNHVIANERRLAESITYAVNKAGKLETKYVVASLPEAKSFVRLLSMAAMSDAEIDGAIPWELEQDIPVPVDQVYLDWEVVAKTGDKLTVLVAATQKDYVDSLVESLKLAHLRPVALELESQAVARCVVGLQEAKETVLILDIASVQTTFIIVEDGVLKYTSSIGVAGNALTESIARSLGISAAEAEKLKKDTGLVLESRRNVRQAILPILDNIIDEIKNVARFHEEHSASRKPISKILLCGGSARLAGVADYVSTRVNLGSGKPLGKVQLGNPWSNLAITKIDKSVPQTPEQALSFTTAIGLALRGVIHGS